MASKKSKKNKNKERRLKEVLKAHAKSGMRGEYLETITGANDPEAKQPKKLSHRLDLKVIKTDLINTGLFVVFVIILLLVLKEADLDLSLLF